jgi:2-dehydro-3-deoxyphosphogluconate aldolase / (4S)-4-hydroxy-2-oxoglutarate aldolase
MTGALARIADLGVVPVVTLDDPANAESVGRALVDGGLPLIELTFRRAGAERALAALAAIPDLLVGAGTVRTPQQVDLAVDSGAAFVVCPCFDRSVIERAGERGVPVLPGVATPTELHHALTAGLSIVKVFPAGPLGGVQWLRALAAPFPEARFVPTGGVTEANLAGYLAVPSVIAAGGSWIVGPEQVAAGDWAGIADAARRARDVVSGSAA